MKKVIIVSASIGVVLIAASLFVYLKGEYKNPRIGYVDNTTLFNEFSLKKELESEIQKRERIWTARLDSIKINVDLIAMEIQKKPTDKILNERLSMARHYYSKIETEINNEQQLLSEKYNEQIWNQLNSLVEEFAKSRNIDFLLGTSGNGNVMYSDDNYDLTSEALIYVNERYEGKK